MGKEGTGKVGGNKEAKAKPKESSFEISTDAPTFVFDETKFGIRRRDPGIPAKKNPQVMMMTDTMNVPDLPTNNNDLDDIADMEASQIWERLKSTVHDIHASDLRGKERKKYLLEKVTRLGGVGQKQQEHPRNIRIGMRLKAEEREKKIRKQALESNVVLAKKSGPSSSGSKRLPLGKRTRKQQ